MYIYTIKKFIILEISRQKIPRQGGGVPRNGGGERFIIRTKRGYTWIKSTAMQDIEIGVLKEELHCSVLNQ